jgi:hypothetical protein
LEILKEEYLSVGGRINIYLEIKRIGSESREWFHMAQDGDWWRVLMKTAVKLHSFISGSTALCWALAAFPVS